MTEKKKRKLYIAIAGNIGAGKTTLTRMLSKELGWKAYYERVIDNPYLPDFYGDMHRWSFHLQIFFLSNRFRSQKEISDWPDSCIQDRTIYEDVEIFAYTLHKQGYMSDRDYANYRDLFDIMISYLRKPDLIMYLRAPMDCLLERIRKRGRDYEKDIDVNYLTRLNESYEEWVERAAGEGITMKVIDIANRDFEHNEEDFRTIYQPIREMEKQVWIEGL